MSRKPRSSSNMDIGAPPRSRLLQFHPRRGNSGFGVTSPREMLVACLIEADALAALARAGGCFMPSSNEEVFGASNRIGGNLSSAYFSLLELTHIDAARKKLAPMLGSERHPLPLVSLRSADDIRIDVLNAYFGVSLSHPMRPEDTRRIGLQHGDTVLIVWYEMPPGLQEYSPLTVQPLGDLPTMCALLCVLELPSSFTSAVAFTGSHAHTERVVPRSHVQQPSDTGQAVMMLQRTSHRLLLFQSAHAREKQPPDMTR